jgi:2-phosphosulfolactate phosphatase
MKLMVSGGRAGAEQAAHEQRVAIIVDALRASATTASLLHHGAREIVVVEDVEAAFAEHARHARSWLVGERGNLRVDGFHLGNSPLQAPLPELPETIIFNSSNMSRCCVGAASCPAVFLGTLPTLTACARAALAAAREHEADIQLVPAGAAQDEHRFVLEDHIASGALIARMQELAEGKAVPSEHAARAALQLNEAALATGYENAFLATDNAAGLCAMGFEADVIFAAQVDVFTRVPRVVRTYVLSSGRDAAVLAAG